MRATHARSFTAAVLATAALSGAACSKSPTSPSDGGGSGGNATVTSVTIDGSTSLSEGATSQLGAIARRSDGTTQTVTSSATWSSSDPTIATVSATGLLTALRPGTSDISVSYASQTARRTAQVSVARFRLSLAVQSVTALATCDDFTQGLTSGEFAVRVRAIVTSGATSTLSQTTGYPGDPDALRVHNLGAGESANLNANGSFVLEGRTGEFLRVQFNATEWDEQIVLIPPSIRWVRDSRLSDESTSRTHGFANGAFSGLGPNTLTLGNSSCGIRLSYTLTATRE